MKSSPAVSLLLTNLQLLDYYSSEDAFPISVETFTSLKNKGKAFEHIVHHLFQTYQPAEAAARFQGCWPIYEPVQSRELRNVVFKWLTDLKRSGQLQTRGNVIIRRSLFDDCSGERYEELLLALSTMVLRDQVEKGFFKDRNNQTIAYKQCTTFTPSLGLLTPLILAHQSSLTRLLASRNTSKARWRSFLSVLKQKETELAQAASRLPPELSSVDEAKDEEVISKWRNNWLGDGRWLDILIDGDAEAKKDKFLGIGYDKALARHESFVVDGSGKAIAQSSSTSGLVGLEKQVEEQKRRVGELRKMREAALQSLGQIKGSEVEPRLEQNSESKSDMKGLQVHFTRHLNIQIGSEKLPVVPQNLSPDSEGNEYRIFLEELHAELGAVDSPKRRRRPRPIIGQFRPPIDIASEFGLEDQASQSRKTFLPQPASKIAKPSTVLPKSASSIPASRTLGLFSGKSTHEPEVSPEKPALGSRNIFGGKPEKPKASIRHEEDDEEANLSKLARPSSGVYADAPSVERKNSIRSPPSLPPPGSVQRLGSPRSQKILRAQKSPGTSSPPLSDEQFSDIDESVLMTPSRSRATTKTPATSQPSTSASFTPKAARKLTYDDEEMTPKALRYGGDTPRRGLSGKKSFAFEDTPGAEKIVSKITTANYSPERYSPERSSPTKGPPSPTRLPRFGFGFRSPDVSPVKTSSSGFNVFEHSTLLSLGTPDKSTSSSSSQIPQPHSMSLEYKPLSKQGISRLQAPSMHFSSPKNQSTQPPAQPQLQLNLDATLTTPMKLPSAETTPKEELMNSEDYTSVFKSRPKIALSPPFTPAKQGGTGSLRGRLSPEFMSLNSAASVSGSEDGGDWDRRDGGLGFGWGSPSVVVSNRGGASAGGRGRGGRK